MRGLKQLLADCGGQRAAGRDCGISVTTMCMVANGRRRIDAAGPDARARLVAWLVARGVPAAEAVGALNALDQTGSKADTAARDGGRPRSASAAKTASEPPAEHGDARQPPMNDDEEADMILRKQTLGAEARRHFRLLSDPFADPQSADDLYFTPESRFVREFMRDAALRGGFCAIVGESGSGKSTLREDCIQRLRDDGEGVVVIEPYTLSMSSGRDGQPMLARHIAEAVIATLAPGAPAPRSQEGRDRRLHQLLCQSNRAGMRHVLFIEEAHDLHPATLKSLKRFWELKDGMKRLLAVILVGQPELLDKLGAHRSDVREVVQRCVPVTLPPIADPGDYLRFRFERAGADLAAAFETEALNALRDRLMAARGMDGAGVYLGYPLAIANLAQAAMNLAARLGEPTVTADVVRQVRA